MNQPMELDLQDTSSHISSLNKTPASIVQEYAAKNHITPQYNLILNNTDQTNVFKYSLTLNDYMTVGEGSSKKEAKHEAALKLLKKMIADNPQLLDTEFKEWDFDNHVVSPFDKNIKVNAIGKLNDICVNNRLGLPEFKLVREEGQAHAKLFTISCHVCKMIETARHKTKKQAKHLAAVKMVNKLMAIDKSLVLEMKVDHDVPDSVKVLEQVELIKNEYVTKSVPKDEFVSSYHLMFRKNEWLNTTSLIEVIEQFCHNNYSIQMIDSYSILCKIVNDCGMKLIETYINQELLISQNTHYFVFTIDNIYPPVVGIGENINVDLAKQIAATELLTAICLLYK